MSSLHTQDKTRFKTLIDSARINIKTHCQSEYVRYIHVLIKKRNDYKLFGIFKLSPYTFEEAFDEVINRFRSHFIFATDPNDNMRSDLYRLKSIERLFDNAKELETVVLSKEDISFLEKWSIDFIKSPISLTKFQDLLEKTK